MSVAQTPLQQFTHALALWRLWTYAAITETSMHYRRSILGPFWITLNMLIMIATLGVLYSTLFKMDVRNYLPFVAGGLLGWALISSIVNEGASTFISHAASIQNTNTPLPFFAFKVTAKQMITFFHNLLAMLPLYIIFPQYATWAGLLLVPAVINFWIFGVWISLLTGMLCARFRDVTNIISNFMQVCFFITPVFWPPKNIHPRIIVDANLFYHFLELIRAPMLGQVADISHWYVVLGANAIGLAFTYFVFSRYYTRIVYSL